VEKIADYKGGLLNHIETLYRPGDRALALEFVAALGMTTVDTGIGTYLAVHPNKDDLDKLNNVFFLSEMVPRQAAIEEAIQKRIAEDPELGAAIGDWHDKARNDPLGIPHFGLSYPSVEALAPVVETLRNGLSLALKERVSVKDMPVYEDPSGIFPDVKQVFVYTDVLTAGGAAYGQLIELQVEL
jgi:hypothetical protein